MDWLKVVPWRLSTVALAMGSAFLVVACQATPSPTSVPPVELSPDELLASVAEELAAMSTVKFTMIDELESGTQFFGTTLKSVEGEVKSPGAVRMLVDVESPVLGFVVIEMLAVGDQAFMKFSRDAPWAALPVEQVPFNFGGLGMTLSEILPVMEGVTIVGSEAIEDAETIRIEGDVMSEDLAELITSVDSGHAVTLTLWVDVNDHTLHQFRIAGRIFDGDGPETRRLLTIDGINVPVDIELPDLNARP